MTIIEAGVNGITRRIVPEGSDQGFQYFEEPKILITAQHVHSSFTGDHHAFVVASRLKGEKPEKLMVPIQQLNPGETVHAEDLGDVVEITHQQ